MKNYKISCKGCGIKLKCGNSKALGYVSKEKLEVLVHENIEQLKVIKSWELLMNESNSNNKNNEHDKKKPELFVGNRNIICQRCHELKYNHNLSEETKQLFSKLKSVDSNKVLGKLISTIPSKSAIIQVVVI